jgi:O-antigen ligase
MFNDRPILGVGAGCFSTAHATGYSTNLNFQNWLESHSLYIQLAAELGIFGVMAFLIFLYFIFKENIVIKSLLRERNVWLSRLSDAFVVSIICLLVTGIFGHSLYRYTWYMIAALTAVVKNLSLKNTDQPQGN